MYEDQCIFNMGKKPSEKFGNKREMQKMSYHKGKLVNLNHSYSDSVITLDTQYTIPLLRKMARDWDFFPVDLSGLGSSCPEKEEAVFCGDCPLKEEDDLLLTTTLIGDKYLGINHK